MREIVLLMIVAVLCPISVLYPRIGLYAYTWFALMHPDALAWSVGRWPLSPALAAATLLGCIGQVDKISIWFRSWMCWLLLLLLALFGFSTFMAVVPDLTTSNYSLFARVCLMALLIPMLIQTREHLRQFTLVVAFSIGMLGLKWGLTGFRDGGARYGSSDLGGFLGDNNCAALAFAMIIPLCWYARTLVQKNWQKLAYGVMAAGSIAGIVWTHSRGAALSVALVMLILAARSKNKILVILLLIMFTAPAVYLVRDSYFKRMGTLENPEEDSSAASRLAYWGAAVRMWKDHPVFGVGFGESNFMLLLPTYLGHEDRHVAHNTYVQVLVDSGLPALIAYVILMVSVVIWLGRSAKKAALVDPALRAYPWALQAALLAFMLGSTFLSRVTFDLYYILIMMAAAWRTVLLKEIQPDAVVWRPSMPATLTPARVPAYALPAVRQGTVNAR